MRLVAETAAQIDVADVEPLQQVVEIAGGDRTAVEPREVVEIAAGGEVRIDGQIAGQVADQRRAARLSRWQSTPSTVARPRDGRSKSSSSRIVVVLPAPLAPRKP